MKLRLLYYKNYVKCNEKVKVHEKMETQNYIIRESEFGDYEYFAKWETDPVMTEFLAYDEDRTYEDVVTEAFDHKKDETMVDFTIVSRNTGKPIGRIFISRIDRHSDSLDITKLYIGDAEFRGRGVGREIMETLLEFCFTNLHMERVSLDYFTGNKRAAALYESLGFRSEGLARNACKKNGRYYDLNLMSMLRSEFFSK